MRRKSKIALAVTFILLITGYVLAVGYFYQHQSEIIFKPEKKTVKNIIDFAKEDSYQILSYRTDDGEMLYSLFKKGDADKPVILFFNGNAGTVEMANEALTAFIKKGYSVVINIYRGYGPNEGTPSEDAILKDSSLLFKLTKMIFPDQPVVLYGYSLGTVPAIYLASKNDVKGVILEGGFSSIADIAKNQYPFLPVDLIMKDKFKNIENIQFVEEPVIMVHGAKDEVVDVEIAKKLANQTRNVTFKEYQTGTHNNLKSLDADLDIAVWLSKLN